MLLTVGRHPEYSLRKLSEELDLSLSRIRNYIYSLREEGCIVEAPPYDNEKGYKREMTWIGEGKLRKKLDKMNLKTDYEKLHIFVPRYRR